MGDLDGVRLKLARAREHREHVDRLIRDFRNTPSYGVRPEIDPNTGEQRWLADGIVAVPDPGIAIIAGDSLYDFRCTLDHVAWLLGERSEAKRLDQIMFPLHESAERFLEQGFRRIRELKPEMIAAIVMTQPCYGWNRYFNASLCALEYLTSIDKHRHLNIVAAAAAGGLWEPPSAGPEGHIVYEGPVEHGTVLAVIPPDEVKVNFFPVRDVAFADMREHGGRSSVGRLMLGIDSAVWRVLEEFRTRFFPGEPPFPHW